MTPVTISTPGSFRNERAYPFCPGCGHSGILDALDSALQLQEIDPARVVIVSDIGCSGLSDQYFDTSAFHGLHGRSITYASGIKLARPDLDVVVVMGDGGTGIGGAHLINAARRNIGLTVLVFNNMNFGMTGGQHSTTTPTGAVTATTPGGNLERPLDICGTAAVNGAGFVWRGTSFDKDLPERIAEAMGFDGFALLDIWELCTAYFVRSNKYSRRAIDQTLQDLDFATGILQHRPELPEYSAALAASAAEAPSPLGPAPITAAGSASLDRRYALIVAGAAGGRVRSAARLFGRAAIESGLFAAQRDDYPITVRTGHSVSTLILAPEPIAFGGLTSPEAALILAPEGRDKIAGLLPGMAADATVITLPEFGDLETPARVVVIDPTALDARLPRADLALAALAAAADLLGIFPGAALDAAARSSGGPHTDRNLDVLAAGRALAAGAR
jgi:pyruvate/2-oxoacid:ferredoxin oxidoreductase beta subunit/Pyruvate/2-oxoacid:ferredoxin oxidoreductase gamma subunit